MVFYLKIAWIVCGIFSIIMCYITINTQHDNKTMLEDSTLASICLSALAGPALMIFFINQHYNEDDLYNQEKLDNLKNLVYFLPLLSLSLLYFI